MSAPTRYGPQLRSRPIHVLASLLVSMVMLAACGGNGGDTAQPTASDADGGESTATETKVPASEAEATEPEASGTQTIRQTIFPGALLTLPIYVAIDQGFFEDHGVAIETVEAQGGPAAAQALLSGDADIMLNVVDFVLLGRDQGQDLKIIGASTNRGINTVIVRNDWDTPNADAGYPDVMQDLVGAKVGVTQRGSAAENFFRLIADDAGVDPDGFTYVAVGLPNTALAALGQGEIDIWMGFEPGTSIALYQQEVGRSVVDLRESEGPELLVQFSPNILATTARFIEENPQLIEDYSAAIEEAHAWMSDEDNRDALAEVVRANVAVPEELVDRVIEDNLATFGPTVPRQNIENGIAYLKRFGLLESDPTYEDVVASEYVSE